MELDFQKDLLRLMKLLDYKIQSVKHENHLISDFEGFIGTPWLDMTVTDEELADIGLTRSFARLLRPAVYSAQGMNMADFFPIDLSGEDIVSPDSGPLDFHPLFWIGDIAKRIEEENMEVINPELITRIFDDKNSLTFNGLTGDFTYNQISGKLILSSRKFKVLRALLHKESGLVTYEEIAQLFYSAEYNKGTHPKAFSDVLDDLKRDLGILPSSSTSNPNCFENITGTGYRLSLP